MDSKLTKSGNFQILKHNDYLSMCELTQSDKCDSCKTCKVKEEILKEISNSNDFLKDIQVNEKTINRPMEQILTTLRKEIVDLIKNKKSLEFNITNLDQQFALLTLLGFTTEQKNAIYQKEISDFFSLILDFQQNLRVDIDVFWLELTKKTIINILKLLKSLDLTDLTMYVVSPTSTNLLLKHVSIGGELLTGKFSNWKKNIDEFTPNVKNLLLGKNVKKTSHFWFSYSDIPVPGEWEDMAISLELPKDWLKIIFGIDNIYKAVEWISIPVIENLINAIQTKIDLYFSVRDDLTGLFRREKFLNSVAGKEKWTFMILDIDNFKSINDTYGHDAWDKALKKVAESLLTHTKFDKDVVCRRWGEEFIIFLDDVQDENIVKEVYSRIQDTLKKVKIPELNGRKITLSAWAYIADKIEKEKIDEMIREADKKLYESKNTGKNKITI